MRKPFLGIAVVAFVVAAGVMVGWYVNAQQVPPSQVPIGGKVDNVALVTVEGQNVQLYNYAGKNGTLVLFVATRCPVSNDYNQRMAELAKDYTARGFAVIGINPNRTEPADEVARHASERALGFTVVKDPDNKVADYLGASVTPEAYLFDKDWVLRYHGRIDDSRNPSGITSRDLRVALDAVQGSKPVSVAETKAFGCTIKRVSKGS